MPHMTCKPGKWIPCALEHHKEGSLHRMLHVPKGEKLPMSLLDKIKNTELGKKVKYQGHSITVTRLVKQRAVLAHTLKGFQ